MQHMVWKQLSEDQWVTEDGVWRDKLHPQLNTHSVDMRRGSDCFFHPHGYILFHDGRYYLFVSTASQSPDDHYSVQLTLHDAQQDLSDFV
jgi:hypothetical protein